MKVIQNKWIPFKGYKYINLFGLIFTRDKHKISASGTHNELMKNCAEYRNLYEIEE